jgi:microcystin-dependent protein
LNNADDHMRLIKGALKATFPNFTAAALASTQAGLDNAVAATTNGVSVLADAGVNFKTNVGDGLQNPAAGQINLKLGGQLAAAFTYSTSINTMHWFGPATFDGVLTAPGIVPIGGMIMWLDDNLPTVGTWCWANGGALSRTGNGAALYAEWSRSGGDPLRYGAGDGSTTFNVINMQEVSPVGKSTMGGAASPNLLTSIAVGLKTVLGALFGADTHLLTTSEIPSHFHLAAIYDPGHTHSTNANAGGSSTGGGAFAISAQTGATINPSTTNVRVNSSNGLDTTYSAGGGASHSIMQPVRPVNFIIRIG